MSNKWWVLASVACGTFMATLDSSIVNIALPTLTKELAADLFQIKWIVIVYLYVISSLLLPFGRISDDYGRKRIFQIGYLIFIIGSALCGLAPSLSWLIFFRALQASGAAMLMVNGPAIITYSFSAKQRGAALGTMAMVVSAGLISGPSIGGFLITEFGWRSIFWLNLPTGLVGAYLVQKHVRQDFPKPLLPTSFDWAGAILQMAILICLILIFDPPQTSIVFHPGILIIITLILGITFVWNETRVKAPLFDLSLLKIKTFWTANLASFLTFVSFSSVSVMMPFFLEEAMGMTPNKAGLFMTAIPLTIFIIAPISGRLSDRMGGKELSFAGGLIAALGLLTMAGVLGQGIQKNITPLMIILALSSMGLSMGLFQSPNNNAIMSSVPSEKLGAASAFLAMIRNLGFVIGTGLSTGLFSWRFRVSNDFIQSIHFVHLIAAIISIAAMIASLGKKRGPIKTYSDSNN